MYFNLKGLSILGIFLKAIPKLQRKTANADTPATPPPQTPKETPKIDVPALLLIELRTYAQEWALRNPPPFVGEFIVTVEKADVQIKAASTIEENWQVWAAELRNYVGKYLREKFTIAAPYLCASFSVWVKTPKKFIPKLLK